jgi:hypothetical protein
MNIRSTQLQALEAQKNLSHEAKLHYEDHPTDAAAVANWLD